jgi:Right handed beta helix region
MAHQCVSSVVIAPLLQVAVLCGIGGAETLHVPGQYRSLRHALQAAHDGDEVVVEDGIYTGGTNKNLDFHGKRIVVHSANGPQACVIDCQGAGRAFLFHSGETPESVVAGLTIRNGDMVQGGGILCVGSSPTVRNCVFADNTAHPGYHSGGGGMSNQRASSPVVEGCRFIDNRQIQASDRPNGGGGMNNAYGSSPTVTGCTFIGNSAQQGGGMLNAIGCDPILTNCTFRSNTAEFFGGGVITAMTCNATLRQCAFEENVSGGESGGLASYNGSSTVLIGCTFTRNHAAVLAGGFGNFGSDTVVINCTFLGNTASPPDWNGGGGGMVNAGGAARLYDCLFSGNNGGSGEAGGFGGGGPGTLSTLINCTLTGNVANGGGGLCVLNGADVNLVNCVLWNNEAGSHGPEIALIQSGQPFEPTSTSVSSSIVRHGSAAVYLQNPAYELQWGAGNLEVDPLFADPAGGDFSPASGSPAVDAGEDAVLPPDTYDLDGDGDTTEPLPIDLAGAPRSLGCPPKVDLGAYELDPDGVPVR